MSKERKFHELIEQQNQEEKNHVWEKISAKEAEQNMMQEAKESALPKAIPFSWRKWMTVAASSLAAVILCVFAVVKFFPFNNDITDSGNGDRYFTVQSYDAFKTTKTLKEYAEEIEKEILFFDWYAETDHLVNYIWQLKDTQEIICMQEEIVDINTGCIIYLFVVEADVSLEAFSSDEKTDQKSQINGLDIDWKIYNDKAIANFEYEDYRYYLRVKEPIDENYILDLVKELLS